MLDGKIGTDGMEFRKRSRRVARAVAAAMACGCVAGLTGCSLFTPSRDEVPPKEVRVRVTTPAISTKGVLAVALDDANAPLAMDDAEGRLTGYLADVARALAQRLGVQVEFVTDETVSDMASSSEADLYLGADSDDGDQKVTVLGDVLQDVPALFAKGPLDAPVDASDLSGATVGVQSSSAAQDILAACGIDAEQKTYGNANELFEALDNGEVEYVACDSAIGGYLSRAYTDVCFAGALDEPQSFGIALRSVNDDLEDKVLEVLDEIQADGTLDALYCRWFGRLPVDFSDMLLGGITTSAERKQKEEELRAQEEDQDGDGQPDSGDASGQSDGSDDAGSADDAALGGEDASVQ